MARAIHAPSHAIHLGEGAEKADGVESERRTRRCKASPSSATRARNCSSRPCQSFQLTSAGKNHATHSGASRSERRRRISVPERRRRASTSAATNKPTKAPAAIFVTTNARARYASVFARMYAARGSPIRMLHPARPSETPSAASSAALRATTARPGKGGLSSPQEPVGSASVTLIRAPRIPRRPAWVPSAGRR